MTNIATNWTARVTSSEDLAEYRRRLTQARALMGEYRFDALVVTDNDIAPQPPYGRYLSGFHIPFGVGPRTPVVILPAAGEPTLVVPSGTRESFLHLARSRSWIDNIVSGEYINDPEWERQTRWGHTSTDVSAPVVDALRTLGLDEARLGVAGKWAGLHETEAKLPGCRFEPTLLKDGDGIVVDLLEPLTTTNSDWEIETLERAHAAADVMITTFIDSARSGASMREARLAAEVAGLRAGADEVMLFGSLGVEPWAFWDLAFSRDEDRFQEGKIYFVEVAKADVGGFEVQAGRTFVIGAPTHDQLEFAEALKKPYDQMLAAIRPGSTGDELWRIGFETVRQAGFEPWAQFGHYKGFKPSTVHRTANFLPGNHNVIREGQAFVVHPCLMDSTGKAAGFLGDTILVESEGWRHLSAQPLAHEL